LSLAKASDRLAIARSGHSPNNPRSKQVHTLSNPYITWTITNKGVKFMQKIIDLLKLIRLVLDVISIIKKIVKNKNKD
jgi:hypothetical protein